MNSPVTLQSSMERMWLTGKGQLVDATDKGQRMALSCDEPNILAVSPTWCIYISYAFKTGSIVNEPTNPLPLATISV